MVLGAIAAAALDVAGTGVSNWDMGGMVAGLGLSGRGAKVDQKFQRLLSNIDYKIQRQSLHREDIRDLVDLTVSRMDMYNIVTALLLTFSLTWITDNSVVSAEKETIAFPRWFATVFLIHCFSSAGFLLFSLWFSIHCSIVSKSQGTKLLLHFARLTIPMRDEINKLRVRFYSSGVLGRLARGARPSSEGQEGAADSSRGLFGGRGKRSPSPPPRRPPLDTECSDSDDSNDSPGAPQTCAAAEDIEDSGYCNDSDTDFERHLRSWVKERGKWLSYDAYARACMVVGMNQMLQAICYNLQASLFDVSILSAVLCVLVTKLLSLHVYAIDVAVSSPKHILFWVFCEFLPPMLTLPLLLVMPPRNTSEAELQVHNFGRTGLYAVPVFALHGLWTLNLARYLRESSATSRASARLVDSESSDSGIESSKESGSLYKEAALHHDDGLENLPKAFLGHRFVGRNARSLYQVFRLSKGFEVPHDEDWFDHTPAKIVRSFTLILAGWWMVSGIMHAATDIWFDYHQTKQLKGVVLKASWPKPASLFEVGAVHCGNGPDLLIQGPFRTFKTSVLPNASLAGFEPVEVVPSAVFCRAHGCDALAPAGESLGVSSLEELCTRASIGTPPDPVPLPDSWRLVAGAWEAGGSGSRGVLAGWDGSSVTVGGLRRASNGSWAVEPRFRVHPGIGSCIVSSAVCGGRQAARYDQVAALQLGASGRTLAVLNGDGTLDAWALDSGTLAGRWRLGGKHFTGMCHNGSRLYTVRRGESGPILESLPLPGVLAALDGHGESPAGGQAADGGVESPPQRLVV